MQQAVDSARPSSARRARSSAALVLALSLGYSVALVGCSKPDAVSCPSGRYCPAGSQCAARQDVCIFTSCANGKLDAGEVCDDGNLFDGDGCNSTCTSNETCGNSVKDKNEECDYALTPESCTTTCQSKICGNGRPDPGEECDPGFNGTTATCLASCKTSFHGDGWANVLDDGELCDGDGLGNVTTTATYGQYCEFAGTVAGVYQVCNSDCRPGRHGDGTVNRSEGELCDGNSDGNATGRDDCESRTCNWNCTPSFCGDGVTNPEAGESCDDRNTDNSDDCTNGCLANRCGDGIRQLRGSRREACDLGDADNVATTTGQSCPYGETCTFCLQSSCSVATVQGPHCGDGVFQSAHEDCDNALSAACGTCSSSCRWIWPRAAQGSIDVVSAASIVAGDTITINDGTSLAVLEFSDSVGNCTTTAVSCVDVRGVRADNARAADAIRTAMSAAKGWTSNVTPTGRGTPVSLVQALPGDRYNLDLTVRGSSVAVSPAEGAIVVNGMSGGVGCVADDACAFDRDCVSPLKCRSGLCQ